MDILDNNSPQIGSFLTMLDELSNTIQQALQNRTSHLNGKKIPYKPRGLPTLAYFFPYPPKLERHRENPVYQIAGEDFVQRIGNNKPM